MALLAPLLSKVKGMFGNIKLERSTKTELAFSGWKAAGLPNWSFAYRF